jgi:hypothetical protein
MGDYFGCKMTATLLNGGDLSVVVSMGLFSVAHSTTSESNCLPRLIVNRATLSHLGPALVAVQVKDMAALAVSSQALIGAKYLTFDTLSVSRISAYGTPMNGIGRRDE